MSASLRYESSAFAAFSVRRRYAPSRATNYHGAGTGHRLPVVSTPAAPLSTLRNPSPTRKRSSRVLIFVLMGVIVSQSGCPRVEDPIEEIFGHHTRVWYRNGKLVELSLPLNVTDARTKKLTEMADLSSLEELHVSDWQATDAALSFMKECKGLRLLSLRATGVTDASLVHLEQMSDLRQLLLANTVISDQGLKHLKNLTKLEDLDLMNTRISDDGAKAIGVLANLQTLCLTGTKVGDRVAESIGRLRRLRDLDLDNTAVGDSGLAHLKGLANLETLSLTHTQVTDRAVATLQGFAHLRYVDLSGTRATQEGIDRLRRSLPNTTIIYKGKAYKGSEQEDLRVTPEEG